MRTVQLINRPMPDTTVVLRYEGQYDEFVVVCRSTNDRTRNGTYNTMDVYDAIDMADALAGEYGTTVTLHSTARPLVRSAIDKMYDRYQALHKQEVV